MDCPAEGFWLDVKRFPAGEGTRETARTVLAGYLPSDY
jgi:hypothetical protein